MKVKNLRVGDINELYSLENTQINTSLPPARPLKKIKILGRKRKKQ